MRTAKMTRVHFQFIADTLKANKPDACDLEALDNWKAIVVSFANELKRTNPMFKQDKFLTAAGIN